MIGKQRRPERGPHTRDLDQVLVRDREPVQQPGRLAARQRVVRRGGLGQRLVEGRGHDGVDDRVGLLDPLDVRGHDLARRHLAAAQQAGQRDRVVTAQVGHP